MKLDKRDRQGVRTPADLEQKYPFGGMSANPQANVTFLERKVDQLATQLSEFMTTTNVAIEEIRSMMEELHPPKPVYTVTYNLTNCTSSNTVTNVVEGDPFTTSISCTSEYMLYGYSAQMGGVTVPSDAWVQTGSRTATLNIEAVTGNVVINAIANN